ncbi:MAG: L-aspartate oxidase [Dehalococcoidia bacterium]
MAYDYIIIGSGIAGLYTAILAREQGTVLLLTKGSIDECNTKYAQGGIAAPVGPGDSPELHYQDTIAAGAGLCDPDAVRILVDEAADRIADLTRFGIPFDTVGGEVALAREAAHSLPRVLHAGGDATGERIETILSRLARSLQVRILEHCLAAYLVVEEGRAVGVKAIDLLSRREMEYEGRCLILATGGAGQLFRFTTNPPIATGDGLTLAYRAGAEIMDTEFFQFHPTALCLDGAPPFLISEAVRGEGGIMCNSQGRPFMQDYTPDGDLAPRDIVARSIVAEMEKTSSDRVFLDVTHLPYHTVLSRFPSIYAFCRQHGLDITRSLIPVAPAAHYMMGGVRTNVWGETNIAGLFAAGETACTGVHGANRLASNSLLEVMVFAKRILARSREIGEGSPPHTRRGGNGVLHLPQRQPPWLSALPGREAAQALMWDRVGIIRSGQGLEEAARQLAAWEDALPDPTDRPSFEDRSLVTVGRLMAEAALLREESRGAHYRLDFPQPDPVYQRHIIFRRDEEG